MSNEIYDQTKEYFKKNNYVVIRNFLDENTASLIYQYCLMRVQRTDFKIEYAKDDYRLDWDGQFGDAQAPSSFSCYADPMMDALLAGATGMIEQYTGLELFPNYSYWRLYQKGEILEKHRDRDSCEISITLCLGYNISNLDDKTYDWPMWVETSEVEGQDSAPVYMKPGDMIIYKGCELSHWREEFQGLNHAQVFLHYNDKHGDKKNVYDGRPILGIPKKFQRDN